MLFGGRELAGWVCASPLLQPGQQRRRPPLRPPPPPPPAAFSHNAPMNRFREASIHPSPTEPRRSVDTTLAVCT